MGLLKLEVLDYEGPTRWRWRLTQQPGGKFVADHQVNLDQTAAEFEAFSNLHAYLRWNAAPDRRLPSEAALVAEVGEWVGVQVLGPVGPAILRQRPATVQLVMPEEAGVLAYRPLELAHVGGRPLALQNVSFVVQPPGAAEDGAKTPVGERLRMLAVFSLPIDASALNLRRERYALARLVHTIAAANGKAVELRVLQYGVTRQRLEQVLLEAEGWDVLHISGHGLPAGLLLEREDGRRDLVASTQLVELLEPAAGQLKLVTMSSCDSAAVTAVEHLQLLGITPDTETPAGPTGPPGQSAPAVDGVSEGGTNAVAEPLPAVAAELVRRLDCAVVAMRYPVVDDFAIALAGQLYDLVLGKGHQLARAIQLTLPRVVEDPPTPAVPPISVATPALFGAHAVDLRLQPPAGGPLVFDPTKTKLAGFEPEPVRFVGRVAPMARANAALAPNSDHSAVLLHGMAGAGKTACALELAYGHEQAFGVLVWHKAPHEDHDITTALTNFALDLDRKLPGLPFSHLIDNQPALEGFLPTLTEFLERSRVLIVLDNLESLLTERGDWRDDRWGLVIDALVGHDGLSRVILTSQRRPRVLDTRVLVEPIHALSLTEAVLLARELPNLRKLLDGTTELEEAAGRALVARTLAVVQGHPKLIELADGQAADPTALEARLGEADQAWLGGGTRLEAFFEQGESTASPQEYLRVLENWTRGAASGLPEAAATLFHLLCCLEDDDRLGFVVGDNWADVWQRLERPGEPPDLEAALAPLISQGLVAVDRDEEGTPATYYVHPGVATAGRIAAGKAVQTAVDNQLTAFWTAAFLAGLKQEAGEVGRLVLHAGRAVAPYLLRLGNWDLAQAVLEEVLVRDDSPATVVAVMPLVRRLVEATATTDQELSARVLLSKALLVLHPNEGEAELRELLRVAEAKGEISYVATITSRLISLLRKAGRFEEALALTDRTQSLIHQAGFGPWAELAIEAQRMRLLQHLGRSQEVLDRVQALRPTMTAQPSASDGTKYTETWSIREGILDIGVSAAKELGHWRQALDLNAEIATSKQRRGAPALTYATTRFNDYQSLLNLGRLEEARHLLLACREIFESEHDISRLSSVTTALADVEDRLGHFESALRLAQDALRLHYVNMDPYWISMGHVNFAVSLERVGGDAVVAFTHFLAAAVLRWLMRSGRLASTLQVLADRVARLEDLPLPMSLAELCHQVDRVEGVHFADVLSRLSADASGGDEALADIVRRVQARAAASLAANLDQQLLLWDPVLAAMVAAAEGDKAAAAWLEQSLTTASQQGNWTALAGVLRRILAGKRDQHLLQGLSEVDTAIAQRALDALVGRVQLDPDSWQTLTSPALPDELVQLVAAVVAAARGDQEVAAALEPVLTEWASDQSWTALAGVLRRILAGERDPQLLQGLEETDTAVVTTILDQLSSQPSAAQP